MEQPLVLITDVNNTINGKRDEWKRKHPNGWEFICKAYDLIDAHGYETRHIDFLLSYPWTGNPESPHLNMD